LTDPCCSISANASFGSPENRGTFSSIYNPFIAIPRGSSDLSVIPAYPSFPRKRESMLLISWIPASAGMTIVELIRTPLVQDSSKCSLSK
jgi:hypothetical protein